MTTDQVLTKLLRVEDALRQLTTKDAYVAGNAIEDLNPVILKLSLEQQRTAKAS